MKNFAVIGNPIAHSRSPEIHQAFARQAGIAITYRRIEAPVTADGSGFFEAAQAFFAAGGAGMNVTAPFKDTAFQLAYYASERSRLAAAANTLTSDGQGGWHADNTDGIGLVRDLTGRLGLPLTGQRILILGAGGATAGILGPLLDARPSQMVLWNRSADKAQQLVRRFATAYPEAALFSAEQTAMGINPSCNYSPLSPTPSPARGEGKHIPSPSSPPARGEGNLSLPPCVGGCPEGAGEGNLPLPPCGGGRPEGAGEGKFDLVIHATSLKAGPDKADEAAKTWPWLNSLCAPDTFFYDLSYSDNGETFFLRLAEACGARRWSDGLGMLIEQAAESFRIWHGHLPETAPVFAALRLKK